MPRKSWKNVNRTKAARHFDSFDFSTLYTNIPHDLFLDNISQLISEAYRIRGAKYLVVQGDSTAYWSNTMSTRDHSITKDELVEQMNFLVETSISKQATKFLGKL